MKKFVPTIVTTVILIAAFTLVSFTNTAKESDEKVNTTTVETTTVAYTNYRIEVSYDKNVLANQVKTRMSEGWQPQGGVSHTGSAYAQAMAK